MPPCVKDWQWSNQQWISLCDFGRKNASGCYGKPTNFPYHFYQLRKQVAKMRLTPRSTSICSHMDICIDWLIPQSPWRHLSLTSRFPFRLDMKTHTKQEAVQRRHSPGLTYWPWVIGYIAKISNVQFPHRFHNWHLVDLLSIDLS